MRNLFFAAKKYDTTEIIQKRLENLKKFYNFASLNV